MSKKSRTFGRPQWQHPSRNPTPSMARKSAQSSRPTEQKDHFYQDCCSTVFNNCVWDTQDTRHKPAESVQRGCAQGHHLLLGQTYSLANALLMNAHMERRQLSPFWTLMSREWTFTPQLHLTTTPFEHRPIKEGRFRNQCSSVVPSVWSMGTLYTLRLWRKEVKHSTLLMDLWMLWRNLDMSGEWFRVQ